MDLTAEAHESEAITVARARQGSGAAWEALVHTHQETVFRFAYLLLGDVDEAEDIAQETFIRAYRALDRFDTERRLRPWLMSICANLARNQRRSIGRYLSALKKLIYADPPPVSGPSVEDQSSQRWQAQRLWQAVQRLNEKDQQIVYMRFFLELSVEETARAMGVAEGTIKSRLHRALGRLRTVIERDFPGLREARFEEGLDR